MDRLQQLWENEIPDIKSRFAWLPETHQHQLITGDVLVFIELYEQSTTSVV